MDAILLAGGLGTRLATTVPHLPKTLAPIRDVPFLSLLLHQLCRYTRVRRIFLALGYKATDVLSFLTTQHFPIPVIPLVETTPLGTGGALLNAYPHTTSDPFLLLNGDSFFDLSLDAFLQFHKDKNASATLAACWMHDASRYGALQIDATSRILALTEKTSHAYPGWINAGIYLFQRSLFLSLTASVSPCSLEKELFPQFVEKGVFAYTHSGAFIDIGTAHSYQEAQEILQPWTRLCNNAF